MIVQIAFSEPTCFELKVLIADCVPWKGKRKMFVERRSWVHSRAYQELSFELGLTLSLQ